MADKPDTVVEVDSHDGRGFQPVTPLAEQVEHLEVASGDDADEEEDDEDELANLPKNVQLRIQALRVLQDQQSTIESEFEKERKLLELKYEKLYQPLYQQRFAIVSGTTEVDAVLNEPQTEENTIKGIPGFWLRALMNHSSLAEMIQERDLPAFEYLLDIRSTSHEDDNGFKLEFVFGENPFFTNQILSKEYDIGEASDSGDAVLRNVIGTVIDWKAGQNLCEVVKKVKQRAKGSKETRVVARTEPCDSFFQFFAMVEMPSEEDEDSEIIMRQLSGDFEIGFTIHESIVPQALLWFTGEAVEDESDYEGEEDDYDEEDEDDSDENSGEEAPQPRNKGKKKHPALDGGNTTEKPPECQNQ